jgi:HlyD family secretion protein
MKTTATPSTRAPSADGPWQEGRVGIALIGLFFGVFGLWAALAPLDSGVVATGEVRVAGNRQVVQHPVGGVISNVAVREGDRVEEGQILIELSAVELAAQERALAGQSIEFEASRERLLAESAGAGQMQRPQSWATLPVEYRELADAVFERQQRELVIRNEAMAAQESVLQQRQRQNVARIDGYHAQIESLDTQSGLIRQELEGLRSLAEEGFAAPTRVRAVERTEAEIVGRRAELGGLIEQSREAVGEARLQALSLREERAERVAEELRLIETQLASINPQLQAIRLQLEGTRVRAPTSGAVVGLAFFNVGAVVAAGERILELVPDEQDMILEVRVRPMDADNVAAGQVTHVRIAAFEGRQVPQVEGMVQAISADRFEDERTGQSYFKVDVRVPRGEIERIGAYTGRSELSLTPGLPVEVVIPQRKRTALQYLLEPLGQSVWRAFREN